MAVAWAPAAARAVCRLAPPVVAMGGTVLALAGAVPLSTSPPVDGPVYRRREPETTVLYEVVRDNLETLYGSIADGAIPVRIPKHARKELEAYLECGLLCCGVARLKCGECGKRRRMCGTAAN